MRSGAIALLFAGLLAGAAPAQATTVTLRSSPTLIAGDRLVTLSGHASPRAHLQLYKSPYPYASSTVVREGWAGATGGFSFGVHPDRDTRYRVATPGGDSAQVQIRVKPRTIVKVEAVPFGQARVTIVIYHPRDLLWGDAPVRWGFGTGSSGSFTVWSTLRSFRLSPYVVVLRDVVALPAGRFRWRVCMHAGGDHALENPARPPGCTGRGYQGDGSLPAGYPGSGAVAAASAFLAGRTGRTAFAVVDSEGRMSGVNVHWTFLTASVVKAMMLVAYLRRLDSMGQRTVDSYSDSFLYPMIHVSDNNAASQCYSIVGNAGLYAVAGAAGMTDFSIGGNWGTALLSPADQARFFFEMDSLIPSEFVGYARYLLSTIVDWQTWAIPVVARPLGYQVFFKDGSEPTGLGELVHQIARLEGHGRRIGLAVMTDGDPSMQYGIDTIGGVAQALLH